MKTLTDKFLAVAAFAWLLTSAQADTLIGTYEINYRYNDGGLPDGEPDRFNPFLNDEGAIHIQAAPGPYRLQVVGIGSAGSGGPSVWTGDASGGTHYYIPVAAGTFSFNLAFGEIVLYYDDWYV